MSNNSEINKSNSEWIVQDGKVKIGTEWKDAKQLKKSFIIELLLAILCGVICVYAFTIHVIFGVLVLFATLFFIFVAMGSVNALKAVGGKMEFKPKNTIKEKVNEMKQKIEPKIAMEPVSVLETNLINTANKKRQAVISKIENETVLLVNDKYVVMTKEEEAIGEISKTDVSKIKKFESEEENAYEYKCKVLDIEKNSSNKNIVKVELLAIKKNA